MKECTSPKLHPSCMCEDFCDAIMHIHENVVYEVLLDDSYSRMTVELHLKSYQLLMKCVLHIIIIIQYIMCRRIKAVIISKIMQYWEAKVQELCQ